jgi:hypothetical protein
VSNVFDTARTLTEIGVSELSDTAAGISILVVVVTVSLQAIRKTLRRLSRLIRPT